MHPSDRLATLRTLQIAVARLADETKQHVFDASAVSKASRWDHDHGRVRVQGGNPAPSVDEDAFLDWVRNNRPDQLTQQVQPAYRRALVARLRVDGDVVVDTKTGEVVPYASPATSTRTVVVDYDRESTVVDDTAARLAERLDAILATLHAGEE